jgi:hypothetical protein
MATTIRRLAGAIHDVHAPAHAFLSGQQVRREEVMPSRSIAPSSTLSSMSTSMQRRNVHCIKLEEEIAHLNKGARQYAYLKPNVRRQLIKQAKRELCWGEAQKLLRKPLIEQYLNR